MKIWHWVLIAAAVVAAVLLWKKFGTSIKSSL